MMNMFNQAESLKDFSQEQLIKEMQQPSGSAPPFLVLSEIQRRAKLRSEMAAPQGPSTTVAQDAVAAAGVPQAGIGGMMQSMAPQTDMVNNTGQGEVQKLAEGGLAGVSRSLGDYGLQGDPAIRLQAGRAGMSVPEYLASMQPEARDQNTRRVERNRFLAMEPLGDGMTFPSQEDLDLRAASDSRNEEVGIGSIPSTMGFSPEQDYMPANMPAMESNAPLQRVSPQLMPEPGGRVSIDDFLAQSAISNKMDSDNIIDVRDPVPGRQPGESPVNIDDFMAQMAISNKMDSDNYPLQMEDATPTPSSGSRGREQTVMPREGETTRQNYRMGPELDVNNLLPPVPEDPEADPTAPPAEVVTPPAAQTAAPSGGGSGGGGVSASALTSGLPPDMVTDADKELEVDYWLALAKFGAALAASSGGGTSFGQDVGTAGSVGLAAVDQARSDYEQRKKDAQKLAMEKAKFDMDMRVANARLAAAGRSGSGGGAPSMDPMSASWYNALVGKRDGILAELESLPPPEEGGWFSGPSDPAADERMRLNRELQLANIQLQVGEGSNGLPIMGLQGVNPNLIDTTQ